MDYEGSLPISSDLAERVEFLEYEKILVGNINNGARFEMYALYGEGRPGIIELNSATACLGKIGDRITIMSFVRLTLDEAAIHPPQVLLPDEKNEIGRYDEGDLTSSFKVVGE